MNHHPDRLTLDRLAADDLPPAAAASPQQHLGSCATCRDYLAGLHRERAARLAAVPPLEFVAVLETRRKILSRSRRFRWFTVGGLGVATAAAAALIMHVGPQMVPGDARFKGGPAPGVTVHRRRGDDVRILGPADRIRAGDALRVELAVPGRTRISTFFMEGATRVDLAQGAGELMFEPGTTVLPGSVVVSAPCSDLILVVESEQAIVRRKVNCE